MDEKIVLGLVVPIGLRDRAAAVAGGAEGAAGRARAELVGRQILLLEHLEGLQIGKLGVAGILQDQRLGAVANHHPLALYESIKSDMAIS